MCKTYKNVNIIVGHKGMQKYIFVGLCCVCEFRILLCQINGNNYDPNNVIIIPKCLTSYGIINTLDFTLHIHNRNEEEEEEKVAHKQYKPIVYITLKIYHILKQCTHVNSIIIDFFIIARSITMAVIERSLNSEAEKLESNNELCHVGLV